MGLPSLPCVRVRCQKDDLVSSRLGGRHGAQLGLEPKAKGCGEGSQDVLSWQAGHCPCTALHTFFCAFNVLTFEKSSLCSNQLSPCVMFHLIY